MKKKHLEYIDIPFDCSFMKAVLSIEEYALLKKYGTWMNALYTNKIEAITEKQKNFMFIVELSRPPKDKLINVFWKYLKRRALLKSANLNDKKVTIKDDRSDWKKIRNMRF